MTGKYLESGSLSAIKVHREISILWTYIAIAKKLISVDLYLAVQYIWDHHARQKFVINYGDCKGRPPNFISAKFPAMRYYFFMTYRCISLQLFLWNMQFEYGLLLEPRTGHLPVPSCSVFYLVPGDGKVKNL